MPDLPDASDVRWQRLVEIMLAQGEATYGSEAGAKRAFGATSLKTDGRIFAMLVKGLLVVKLPAARVAELAAAGAGVAFDPGHGRIQREWFEVATDDEDRWLALATEAEAFVARRPPA